MKSLCKQETHRKDQRKMKPETQTKWNINKGLSQKICNNKDTYRLFVVFGVSKEGSQALPASDAQFLKWSPTSQRK